VSCRTRGPYAATDLIDECSRRHSRRHLKSDTNYFLPRIRTWVILPVNGFSSTPPKHDTRQSVSFERTCHPRNHATLAKVPVAGTT